MEPSYGACPAVMAPYAGCGRVALAVKIDVSFHPLSVRAIGTQAEVLQPETIVKLIELTCRPSLLDMVNVMNHEVGTRRPGCRTYLITLLLRQMSDNSRWASR